MKRVFGRGNKKPHATMEEVTGRLDKRTDSYREKINRIDQDLIKIKQQLKKTRPGPAQNGLRTKGARLLKQKKMYEKQEEALSNQAFTIDQVAFTTDTLKDNVEMVSVMKDATKEMKKQYKKVNIDKIDDMQDELADLMDNANLVQDALGQGAYDVDVDEGDLDAELDMLADDIEMEATTEEGAKPSYLNLPSPEEDALPDLPEMEPMKS